MPFINTERLKMVTFTVEMIEAILKGPNEFKKITPYKVVPEWPLDDYKQFFHHKIKRFRNFPAENEWEGIIIDKNDDTIIGDMGFKGGPNKDGIIDLGYSIVPSCQCKGYATEMGKAFVNWGISQPDVKKIVATCHPENVASLRVLEKIGFYITKKTKDKFYWSY